MGGLAGSGASPPPSGDLNSLDAVVCEHFLTNGSVTDAAAVNYLAAKWGISL